MVRSSPIIMKAVEQVKEVWWEGFVEKVGFEPGPWSERFKD